VKGWEQMLHVSVGSRGIGVEWNVLVNVVVVGMAVELGVEG
jgi:hypothetical protein